MNIVKDLLNINVSLLKLFRSPKKEEVVKDLIDDYLLKEKTILKGIKNLEDKDEICGILLNYDLKEEYHDCFQGLSDKEIDLVEHRAVMSMDSFLAFDEMRENLDISYLQTKDFVSNHRIRNLGQHFCEYLDTYKRICPYVLSYYDDVVQDDVAYLLSTHVSSYEELYSCNTAKHQLSDDEIKALNHDYLIYLESALTEKEFFDFQFCIVMTLAILKEIPQNRRGDLQEEVTTLLSGDEIKLPRAYLEIFESALSPLFMEVDDSCLKKPVYYYDKYSYDELMNYSILYFDFQKLNEKIWKYRNNDFVLFKLFKEESHLIAKLDNPYKFLGFLHDVCDDNLKVSDFELMSEWNQSLDIYDNPSFKNLWIRRLQDKIWLSTRSEAVIELGTENYLKLNIDPPDLVELLRENDILESLDYYENGKINLQELLACFMKHANEKYCVAGTYVSNADKIISLSKLDYQVIEALDNDFLKELIIFRYNMVENAKMIKIDSESNNEEKEELAKHIYEKYFSKVEKCVKGKKGAEFLVRIYKNTYEQEILKKNRIKR